MESSETSTELASSADVVSNLSMLIDPQVFLDTRILLRITDYAMWIAAGVIIGLVIRSVIRVVRGHSRPTGRNTAIVLSIILAASYVAVWHHFGMIPTLEPLLWASSHALTLAAALFWILRRWDRPPADFTDKTVQQPLLIESDDVHEIERRRSALASRLNESLDHGDSPRATSERLRVDADVDKRSGRGKGRAKATEAESLPWLDQQGKAQKGSPKRRSRAPSTGTGRKKQAASGSASTNEQKPAPSGGRTAQIPPRRRQRRQNVFETSNPLGPTTSARTAPAPAAANPVNRNRTTAKPAAAGQNRPAAMPSNSRSAKSNTGVAHAKLNGTRHTDNARSQNTPTTRTTLSQTAHSERKVPAERNATTAGSDSDKAAARAPAQNVQRRTPLREQKTDPVQAERVSNSRTGTPMTSVEAGNRETQVEQTNPKVANNAPQHASRPSSGEPTKHAQGPAVPAADLDQRVERKLSESRPEPGSPTLRKPTPPASGGVFDSPAISLSQKSKPAAPPLSDHGNGQNNFLNPTRAADSKLSNQEEPSRSERNAQTPQSVQQPATADVAAIETISPAPAPSTSGVRTINIAPAQQQQPAPPPRQAQGPQHVDASEESTDYFYELSWSELQSGSVNPALWAKAYANADGEDAKARAWYIRYRVSQLEKQQQINRTPAPRNRQAQLHAVRKAEAADDRDQRANNDRKVTNQEKISVARAVKAADDGTETLNCKCCNHALVSADISATGIATVACNSCGQYSDVYTVAHEPILVKAHPHLTQSGSCIFCSDIGDTDAKLSDGSEYHESCYERMLLEFDELVEDHGADHRATSTYRAALHRVYDHWPDFPPDWAIRRQGKIVDSPQCNFCDGRNNLELAHKTSLQRGGSNLPNNLELICRPCLDSRQANLSRSATRVDRPVGA